MKKLLAIGLAALLCGCGGKTPEPQRPVNFPTATASGALYAVGAAISDLWNNEIPALRVSSRASNGGIDNLNQLADGEAQVTIAIASNCLQSQNGTDGFEGYPNPNLRVLAPLYANPNQVVVKKGSAVQTLVDLKGKRFAVASAGSSVEGECRNHFTAAGLQFPSDLLAEPIAFGDAAELLQNGSIEGAWIMSGAPAAAVTQACAGGARLLSLEDELIGALQAQYPWYLRHTIPANTYPNQTADVTTTAIPMMLVCNADWDETLAYRMTKLLWENIESLGKTQPNLRGLTPKAAIEQLSGLTLHEGAARYYREIGVLS